MRNLIFITVLSFSFNLLFSATVQNIDPPTER
ncbi:MAG: hypothetical protein ACI8P3_002585, partial [Saprospiraceae bacterium]